VWQSLFNGPQDEDMNIKYCDLMLCIFCALIGHIGTLFLDGGIVIVSLLCYFNLCDQVSINK
jgi:hypothetical protein